MEDSLFALDRVYFSDELAHRGVKVVWLRWRPAKKWLRFADWDASQRAIRVHRTMALLEVPDYWVLSTLHHEACHVLFGPKHDARFMLAEQRFAHHAAAQSWFASGEWENLLDAPRPF